MYWEIKVSESERDSFKRTRRLSEEEVSEPATKGGIQFKNCKDYEAKDKISPFFTMILRRARIFLIEYLSRIILK